MLSAAAEVVRRGLARITLLGEPGEVAAAANRFNADISGCAVVDPGGEALLGRCAQELAAARKDKGMSEALARDLLGDFNYMATSGLKIATLLLLFD